MEVKEAKGFKKLKQNMKGMTLREKAVHLWTYYRWVIIVVVMAILTVSGGCAIYKNANSNTVVAGLCLNLDASDKVEAYLTTSMKEEHGLGRKYEDAHFFEMILEDFSKTEDIQGNQYTLTAIHAMFNGQEIDYMITDLVGLQNVYDVNKQDQAFYDLRKFFSDEQWDQIKVQDNKILYIGGAETGIPVAVNIADLPIVQEQFKGVGDGPIFFCIISNTERLDKVHAVWDYLNNWEG